MKKIICALLSAALVSLSVIPSFAADTNANSGSVYGDVNGDGDITITDVTLIQKHIAKYSLTQSFILAAADVDGDGSVTVSDVSCVQKYIAGQTGGTGRTGETIAATQHRLVKSVKKYTVNYDTGDWELESTTTIDYENAYPKTISIEFEDEDFPLVENEFEYTFEDGVPKTCKVVDIDQTEITTMEYDKGRLFNVHTESDQGGFSNIWYQYANGNDYFTSLVSETEEPPTLDGTILYREETDSVQVTLENGLIKKSVNSGMYANWDDKTPKRWLRFWGTYTAEYDSDGIARYMHVDFRDGRKEDRDKIEVTKENGVITGAVVNPGSLVGAKYEFVYTDTEISAPRFSNMINYFLVGKTNNFYNNNWF